MQDIITCLLDSFNNNPAFKILVYILLSVIMFYAFVQAGYSIGKFLYYLFH